jgi:hypothetical protein
MERFCARGVIYKHEGGLMRAMSVGCGRRACTQCGEKRRKLLVARAAAGDPSRTLTITLPVGLYKTQSEGCDAIRKALRELAHYWRKRHGPGSMEYAAFIELTEKGTPHAHVLLACKYIDQAFLSRFFEEHGCGRIAHIRKVGDRRHAARYAAKYVSKSEQHVDGRRSVSFSALYDVERKLKRWERKEKSLWRYSQYRFLSEIADRWEALGHAVEWVSSNEVVACEMRGRAESRR